MNRYSVFAMTLLLALGCSSEPDAPPPITKSPPASDADASPADASKADASKADASTQPPLRSLPAADAPKTDRETSPPADSPAAVSLDDEARRWIALRADDDPRLRAEAEEYLLARQPESKLLLQAAAADSDPVLRFGAAYALLAVFDGRDAQTAGIFLRLLADPDAKVRGMALQAVGRLQAADAQRAVEPLAAMLASPHESDHVRSQAARLLGDIESEAAFVALRTAARKDSTARVRTAALGAAVSIAPDEAALLALLSDRLTHDTAPVVLKTAIFQLGKLGPAAAPAADSLAKLLGHEDDALRTSAARTLAEIGEPAVSSLIAQLESSQPRSVLGAMAALFQMEPPPQAAVAPLKRLQSSADPAIRSGAAAALKRLGAD